MWHRKPCGRYKITAHIDPVFVKSKPKHGAKQVRVAVDEYNCHKFYEEQLFQLMEDEFKRLYNGMGSDISDKTNI